MRVPSPAERENEVVAIVMTYATSTALMSPPRARGGSLLEHIGGPPPARTMTSMVSWSLALVRRSLSCRGTPPRSRRRCSVGMFNLSMELVREVFPMGFLCFYSLETLILMFLTTFGTCTISSKLGMMVKTPTSELA
jgi:hypothetical protein